MKPENSCPGGRPFTRYGSSLPGLSRCRPRATWLIRVALRAALLGLTLTACGAREPRICPSETPFATASPHSPQNTPLPPELIQAAWEGGPHARAAEATDLTQDPLCRECHRPLERVGQQAPVQISGKGQGIPGSSGVGCAVCHPGDPAAGDEEIAWLIDPSRGVYEPVDSPGGLCERCHSAGGVEGHLPVVIAGAHADFSCVECHDPHDGGASCTGSGCHQPFQRECEPIQTHDKPHRTATCASCHAAGDPVIDWDEGRQAWGTFYPVQEEGGEILRAHFSHHLVLEVDCDRCHTPGELPWEG